MDTGSQILLGVVCGLVALSGVGLVLESVFDFGGGIEKFYARTDTFTSPMVVFMASRGQRWFRFWSLILGLYLIVLGVVAYVLVR